MQSQPPTAAQVGRSRCSLHVDVSLTGISSRQMQRALDIAQSTALSLGTTDADRVATPIQNGLDGPDAGTDKTRVFPNVHATPEAVSAGAVPAA